MASAKTTVRDRGAKRILRELGRMNGAQVTVGWPTRRRHAGGDLTMAKLAATLEYGAPRAGIPARPVLRPAMERNATAHRALSARLAAQVSAGRMTADGMLATVGARLEADLKREINRIRTPPLAESTVRRKGSSKPWIDTGALRDAAEYKVKIGRGA